MRKFILTTLLILLVSSPAAAQFDYKFVSFGYAFSHYLEEGGGNVPLGLYISSGASTNGKIFIEGDFAYHRDTNWFVDINTLIACTGPRFAFPAEKVTPYIHLLGGVRFDSNTYNSNYAFGGMIGSGIDLQAGEKVFLHFGADFQIFFDEGENLKTLRVVTGLAF